MTAVPHLTPPREWTQTGVAAPINGRQNSQANIYVASLPVSGFTTNDLKRIFEPFGKIVGVHLMRDKRTGHFNGCGFVCYDQPSSALLATQQILYYHGKKLQVRFANRHLYFKSTECDVPCQQLQDPHLYIDPWQPKAPTTPPGLLPTPMNTAPVAMLPLMCPTTPVGQPSTPQSLPTILFPTFILSVAPNLVPISTPKAEGAALDGPFTIQDWSKHMAAPHLNLEAHIR